MATKLTTTTPTDTPATAALATQPDVKAVTDEEAKAIAEAEAQTKADEEAKAIAEAEAESDEGEPAWVSLRDSAGHSTFASREAGDPV
jgi:hypothetical protein